MWNSIASCIRSSTSSRVAPVATHQRRDPGSMPGSTVPGTGKPLVRLDDDLDIGSNGSGLQQNGSSCCQQEISRDGEDS